MHLLWIVIIFFFAVLHLVHLCADFPNYSRWMDWSKYTDEGWWGNAAIQHFVRGSWFVPGDFNTGAALPVWPFLEWVVFHFTGVSVQAARALAVSVFFCNVLLSYVLVRLQEERWVALLASSLIAVNAFLFCFSRLAILEPLLLCLTLLSLIVAQHIGSASATRVRKTALSMALGSLCVLMILTKTTAIVLLPAILYSMWYPQRRDPAAFVRSTLLMGGVAGLLWGGYYALLVRLHYIADFKYLFAVDDLPRPNTVFGWVSTFYYAAHGVLWIDRIVVVLSLLFIAASLLFVRSLWHNPTFVSSLLAIGGYIFFIAYHNNMQPRYYAVIALFLFLVVAISTGALLRSRRTFGLAALSAIAFSLLLNALQVGKFTRHPEYTFVNAAEGLTRYIDQHPNGDRLLLSVSGNEITLITGLPSICDDYGTIDLPSRLQRYQPGWYAAWDEVDPGTLEDIYTQYSLEEVASFPAFDDPERSRLILYKLRPLPSPKAASTINTAGIPFMRGE